MNLRADQLNPFDYSPKRDLIAKIRRRAVQWTSVAPLGGIDTSVITFSFDDFPKSAAENGADILGGIDAKAIYYACSGLSGKTTITGEQYEQPELDALMKAGHEIGAHTHTHRDCALRPVDKTLEDIEQNLSLLKDMGVNEPIRHFAYPYGETNIELKKALTDKFGSARGILSGQNASRSDKMQLRAMELTPDTMTIDRAIHAIEHAQRTPSWLHIFTHDVRAKPSDYGVTRAAFLRVVKAARNSGLPILPPKKAMQHLRINTA